MPDIPDTRNMRSWTERSVHQRFQVHELTGRPAVYYAQPTHRKLREVGHEIIFRRQHGMPKLACVDGVTKTTLVPFALHLVHVGIKIFLPQSGKFVESGRFGESDNPGVWLGKCVRHTVELVMVAP